MPRRNVQRIEYDIVQLEKRRTEKDSEQEVNGDQLQEF